jgi:hypothetical protein
MAHLKVFFVNFIANSGSCLVEHSSHHQNVEVLSIATAAGKDRERMAVKNVLHLRIVMTV